MKSIVSRRIDGDEYVKASEIGPLLNDIKDLTIQRAKIQEQLEDIEAELLSIHNLMVPGSGYTAEYSSQISYAFAMGKVAARLINCIEDLGELIEN